MYYALKYWEKIHIRRYKRVQNISAINNHPNAVRYSLQLDSSSLKRAKVVKDVVDVYKKRKCVDIQRVMRVVSIYYRDEAFDQLPYWIRNNLKVNKVHHVARNPTGDEMLDTVKDAREHRKFNNEVSMEDYKDHYFHGTLNLNSII
jgi:hypothetical protein